MAVTCMDSDRCLRASISGELDHHHAKQIMMELDRQIDAAMPRRLVLDLGELTFSDSSGIAVLIRAFRRMEQLGGTMRVCRIPEQAKKVFWAAGLQRLMIFE